MLLEPQTNEELGLPVPDSIVRLSYFKTSGLESKRGFLLASDEVFENPREYKLPLVDPKASTSVSIFALQEILASLKENADALDIHPIVKISVLGNNLLEVELVEGKVSEAEPQYYRIKSTGILGLIAPVHERQSY